MDPHRFDSRAYRVFVRCESLCRADRDFEKGYLREPWDAFALPASLVRPRHCRTEFWSKHRLRIRSLLVSRSVLARSDGELTKRQRNDRSGSCGGAVQHAGDCAVVRTDDGLQTAAR